MPKTVIVCMKIRILDEKTINQIAAGEVIESPASVVKELVDNALDAGATKIVVEAVNSGRQLLRVQDNGSGMGHDDVLLCIERHATSKIRSLDDLWALDTMGFRGEALSSVASISEFRIFSGPHDIENPASGQVPGSALHVMGGKIASHEKVHCLAGTTIEVKSLFYNVPARKKFLKSPAKDASDIMKVLMNLALSHPKVAFELILNHTREFSWRETDLDGRIKEALGSEFFQELVPVSYQKGDVRVYGYIAKPTYSRPTRSHQYLFVNNRPVQSLALSLAAKEGYGSSIDPARHPAFILFVEVAKNAVDVNVHPQKKEVRLSTEEELKQVLIQAVSASLFTRHTSQTPVVKPLYMRPISPVFQSAPEHFVKQVQEVLPEVRQSFRVHAVYGDVIIADIEWPKAFEIPEELTQEGLFLISATRAIQRLAFDGSKSEKECSIQNLLVPIFIELTASEAGLLRSMLTLLRKAGIIVNDFGKNSFLVEGIPSFLEQSEISDIIRALVEDESIDVSATLAKACSAVQAKKAVSREQAVHLVQKLLECSNPFYCPVGDKIVAMLTKQELGKKFK